MASKEQDIELFNTWKASGDKKDLGNLIHALYPIIYSEVQRASGTLPTSALSAEAKKHAVRAIMSYDPSKGASLSTHVMNVIPKVRRLNYKFQNSARLPENLQLQYHEWHKGVSLLQEQLEREPTDEELARQLGWKKKAVIKYKNSLYSDLVESASERPTETHTYNKNKVLYDYILEQLTPEEKVIFENIDTMTSTELATRLNVNINRLNYLKRILIDKVKRLQGETKWSS